MRKEKMNEAVPNLTPPGKGNGKPATKAEKPPKEAKPQKEPKPPKDPNAPKVPRAPRTDYGYHPAATINIVAEKEAKFRGARLTWFNTLKEYNGKKVAEWVKSQTKEGGDPPRGWLRFFVQEGAVILTGAPPKEVTPPAATTEQKPAS
jgi:hypothetical protein